MIAVAHTSRLVAPLIVCAGIIALGAIIYHHGHSTAQSEIAAQQATAAVRAVEQAATQERKLHSNAAAITHQSTTEASNVKDKARKLRDKLAAQHTVTQPAHRTDSRPAPATGGMPDRADNHPALRGATAIAPAPGAPGAGGQSGSTGAHATPGEMSADLADAALARVQSECARSDAAAAAARLAAVKAAEDADLLAIERNAIMQMYESARETQSCGKPRATK